MGLCFTRDKEEYVKYDRYIYCSTCLAKIPYDQVYIMAYCANKSFVFCSRQCYGHWVYDK